MEYACKVPDRWPIENFKIKILDKIVRLSSIQEFFPEHVANWDWIREKISGAKRKVSVLNLFGYTGGASLAAAQAVQR